MKQGEDVQQSLREQKLCVGVRWTEEDRTGKSWLYLILISCRHKAGVPSAVRARHWLPSLPVTAFIYSTQVTNKWQGHTHHHHTHRAHVPNSKGGGGGAAPRLIQKCEHVWPLLWWMSLSLGNVRDVSRWLGRTRTLQMVRNKPNHPLWWFCKWHVQNSTSGLLLPNYFSIYSYRKLTFLYFFRVSCYLWSCEYYRWRHSRLKLP